MKRSEMRDVIENTIIDNNGYGWSVIYDSILEAIEEAGMLPPNDGKKRYIKPSSVPCVVQALKCHQWEDENE